MQPRLPDETPRSPTHKKVTQQRELKVKLRQCLHDNKLKDLALDYLGTQTFNDVYLFEELLGAGAFGVVLRVVERSTGEEYAMKVPFLEIFRSSTSRIWGARSSMR
jgi:hypothetical protein